jgi:hypothetical protein
MRARYQSGNITLKERKGPDVWEFRWYEPDGRLRSKLLGTVEQKRAASGQVVEAVACCMSGK